MGGFSIWHWLIVLVVVVLVFGTKKLRSLGSDLGGAVKGFKDATRADVDATQQIKDNGQTIEGEVKKEKSNSNV